MTDDLIDVQECKDHCCYKMGLNGQMIVCCRCGRIRAIKEGQEFKILY